MGAEWISAFGVIGAACVTGFFAVALRRLTRDNTDQHNRSMDKLDYLTDRVEDVSHNVNGLTGWPKAHEERHRWIEKERANGGS